ncbi:MAG: hypothetical protein K5979_12445 [Ruminococcus sp.]|nr:hypothetical protein [Ruminococcus sp.]
MTENDYQTYGTAAAIQARVCERVVADEELRKKLGEILNRDKYDLSINFLMDKITDNIRDIYYNNFENNFIEIYIMGKNHVKMDDIFNYLKTQGFDITPETMKKFYDTLHDYVLNQLTAMDCYEYVLKTFPFLSKLKRRILEERPGTELKQWQYAAECYSQQAKKDGIFKDFKDINDYHEIQHSMVRDVVCRLVNSAVPGAQFEKTFDGWFPNGIYNFPKPTDIQKNTLFRIAYGFSLSPEQMDSLGAGATNCIRDPFDFEDNMFRFGLNYKMKYTDINSIKSDLKIELKPKNTGYDEAIKILDDFFEVHNDVTDPKNVLNDYLKLLESIGSSDIRDIRKATAKNCLIDVLEKLDIKIVKEYYEKNEENENLPYEFYSSENEEELIDKLSEEIERKRENIKRITNKSYLPQRMEKNKLITLSYIFNGKGFDAEGKENPNPKIITGYKNIIDKKLEISRQHILRLGYLSTLVEYIKGNIPDDNLVKTFEIKTNGMLKTCLFHELYYSFPEDVQMYLALSSNEYCKLDFYQAITN